MVSLTGCVLQVRQDGQELRVQPVLAGAQVDRPHRPCASITAAPAPASGGPLARCRGSRRRTQGCTRWSGRARARTRCRTWAGRPSAALGDVIEGLLATRRMRKDSRRLARAPGQVFGEIGQDVTSRLPARPAAPEMGRSRLRVRGGVRALHTAIRAGRHRHARSVQAGHSVLDVGAGSGGAALAHGKARGCA